MKTMLKTAALLLAVMICIMMMPMQTARAADVEVTASADPTLLFEGGTTKITVTVKNNSDMNVLMMEGIFTTNTYEEDTFPGILIAPNSSEQFEIYRVINFGQNLEVDFAVGVNYSGGQQAFSSSLLFIKDIVQQPNPQVINTLDFFVTPTTSAIKKGEDVTYTVTATNTGNVDYTNLSLFYGTTAMLVINIVDLKQGETHTETMTQTYDADTHGQFSYEYTYDDNGVPTQAWLNDPVDAYVYIIDPGLTITAKADKTEVSSGKKATITVTAKNTGDIRFDDIEINNDQGKQIGHMIAAAPGDQEVFTHEVSPTKTTDYTFTASMEGEYGNKYQYTSNTVTVKVSGSAATAKPTASPNAAASAAAAATPRPQANANSAATGAPAASAANATGQPQATDAQGDAQNGTEVDDAFWSENGEVKSQQGGLSTLAIVLIIVGAALVGAAIPLIIIVSKNKKKKGGKRPPDQHQL